MGDVLRECEMLLGDADGDDKHVILIRKKASDRIKVLSHIAKEVCEMNNGEEDNPVRAYKIVSSVNSLIRGIDGLHHLLRQTDTDVDGIVKQMNEVKRGPYKNLSNEVEGQVSYTEPVSWAVTPAIRNIVEVLKNLEDYAA